MESLVSIIITVYNGSKHIKRMMDTVILQTYKNCEIICVNDGSTDNTAGILATYKQVSTYNIENMGSANARLFGLSKATGEYVIFMDADDFIDPTMIEEMMRMARCTLADMVVCGYNRIKHSAYPAFLPEMNRERHDITKNNKSDLTFINTAMWNKLIRRSVIPDNISVPRVTQGDDMCILLHIYPNVERVTFIPQTLYNYIVYDESLMTDFKEENFVLLLDTIAQIKQGYNLENYDYLCGCCYVAVSSYLNRYYNAGMSKAKVYELYKMAKKRFNHDFIDWYKTKCFRFKTAKMYGIKGIGLWFSSISFRSNVYTWYMRLFKYVKKFFKVRW